MTASQSLFIVATPEQVFDALIDARKLEAWWGSEPSVHYQRWSVDPRLGGVWRCEGSDESCGPYVTHGEILQLENPNFLRISWIEEMASGTRIGPTEVRYTIQTAPEGASITVDHSGFAGYEAIGAEYQQGWGVVLGLLKKWLESGTS